MPQCVNNQRYLTVFDFKHVSYLYFVKLFDKKGEYKINQYKIMLLQNLKKKCCRCIQKWLNFYTKVKSH